MFWKQPSRASRGHAKRAVSKSAWDTPRSPWRNPAAKQPRTRNPWGPPRLPVDILHRVPVKRATRDRDRPMPVDFPMKRIITPRRGR